MKAHKNVVKLPVKTRWTSTVDMLESVLLNRDYLVHLEAYHKHPLQVGDWQRFEFINDILAPLKWFTLEAERKDTVQISFMLIFISTLMVKN